MGVVGGSYVEILGGLVAVALLIGVAAVTPSTAGGPSDEQPEFPLVVVEASLRQESFELRFAVDTAGAWSPRGLDARQRTLCLELRQGGVRRELCLRGRPNGRPELVRRDVGRRGGVVRIVTIKAALKRENNRNVILRFRSRDARLQPGRFQWRVRTTWRGQGCNAEGERCVDRFPSGRMRRAELRPVLPVGCTHNGPWLRRSGSPRGRKFALTFDDGPAATTTSILRVLRRYDVKATFFVVGSQIPGRGAILREIRRQGHELANHTMGHNYYASYGNLVSLNRRIRRETGFQPCSFRPPGGFVNSALVARAHAAGMTTVMWNVDPFDWRTPGAGAIYSRTVSAARPGGIVVLHDGPVFRGQTLAALPGIIRTLKSRGYRLTTVSDVLGQRFIYPRR
jgi:peptidoglycan/xylan/chitin deacetylase (PgdA/CDA1 family)